MKMVARPLTIESVLIILSALIGPTTARWLLPEIGPSFLEL